MAKTILNQKVDVTALYFTNKNGQLKSFPKRIEYDGGHHQFVESGLQMLVQTTSGVIRIFERAVNCVPGSHSYRAMVDNRGSLI